MYGGRRKNKICTGGGVGKKIKICDIFPSAPPPQGLKWNSPCGGFGYYWQKNYESHSKTMVDNKIIMIIFNLDIVLLVTKYCFLFL